MTQTPIRYLIAPAAVGLVTAVKLSVPALDPSHSFLLYLFAVALSGWIGRRSGGILATLLVILMVVGLSSRSGRELNDAAFWLRVLVFAAEGVLMTAVIHMIRTQQERLKESHRGADESRALLQNMIETVPSAIVATEPDGRLFLFNAAAEALTGYKREEVLGQSLLDLFVPDEWKNEVLSRFENPESPSVREPHRNPWRMKSGDLRLIEWRCAALPGVGGNRILGVGIDVTDLRRIEEEREQLMAAEQQARQRAEDANRTKDLFLATVSHELRAPLTAILGWAQMLLMSSDDASRTELDLQGLKAIEENAQAQTRLIDDLIDYARIASGQLRLQMEHVSVPQVVQSVMDSFVPEAQRKEIVFRSSLPEDRLLVQGDEARLRQIFMNVIQNAIRYTDTGYVAVGVERSDGHVVIAVSDSGRGIAPDFLPYVFDRFSRERPAAAPAGKGLGIGLAIVKELVSMHGGSVEASSEGPGLGARFSIRLPSTV